METINESGIKKERKAVKVIAILDQFKKVAHVSQDIVTTYPTRRMNNDKSTGLFDNVADGQQFTSTRHTLIVVPDSATVANVEAQLSKFPNGVIQRVVTNNVHDILTKGDYWAMENGKTTLGDLEVKYETRDTEGNRYSGGEMRVTSSGELVNELLPAEYKRDFYQREFVEDQDLRAKAPVAVAAQETVLSA